MSLSVAQTKHSHIPDRKSLSSSGWGRLLKFLQETVAYSLKRTGLGAGPAGPALAGPFYRLKSVRLLCDTNCASFAMTQAASFNHENPDQPR